MQITSIELDNVCQFAEPARLTGLGTGLNVLTAANEAGKSTFFEALQAAFFLSHRSSAAPVRALVPRVGGDPEVAVGFEIDGAAWEIRKCFTKAKAGGAWLRRSGTLVAQGEEAEEQLAGLIGAGRDFAPTGLLWVRQGMTGMQEGGEETEIRRDIMQSVAGEVDAMTGGRRMETALRACAEFLDVNVTKSGSARKNSSYWHALEEVSALRDEKSELEEQVGRLSQDLMRRRQAREELLGLDAAEIRVDREQRLEDADAALKTAREWDQKLKTADAHVRELTAQADAAAREAAQLDNTLRERQEAQEVLAEVESALQSAQTKLAEKQTVFESEQVAHDQCRDEARTASDIVRKILKAETARAADARRAELKAKITRANGLRTRIEELTAALDGTVDADALRELEALATELRLAQRAREAEAASFLVSYAGKARIRRNGDEVAEGIAHSFPDGMDLDLDGIGRLELRPGPAGSDDSVRQARQALQDALEDASLTDLDAARASVKTRSELENKIRDAQAELSVLAPDGLPDLRGQFAALPDPLEDDDDLPEREQAEAAESAAMAKEAQSLEGLEKARVALDAARETATRLETRAEQASARAQSASEAAEALESPEAALDALRSRKASLSEDLSAAVAAREMLSGEAPALDAAEAASERAKSVIEAARIRISELTAELAGLNAKIEQTGEEAPEERLALVSDQLAGAEDQLSRIEFEIRVYRRLQDALQAAQRDSREKYVQPVLKELVPLLRMIWEDAEAMIDAETGLITAVSRAQVEEEFDILSGGTQEQITLLVRLAFARMLARNGRPAPVILDDAIVYTDDDRIEHMFNALTLQARDLQIIVLSCRQRAFSALGGTPLRIERVGDAA